MITLLLPTSEAGAQFRALSQVGKLVVKNLDDLFVLVSSALPTICRDMTCTVLKTM